MPYFDNNISASTSFGDFKDSLPTNYKKLKALKALDTKLEFPLGFAYLKEKEQIIMTHYESKSIFVLDKDGNFVKEINKHKELLMVPVGVTVGWNSEIFVTDMGVENEKIFVFDKELNYIRHFGDIRIQNSFHIIFDNHKVYLTSFLNNNLSCWNAISGEFLNQIPLNSPLSLAASSDKLFIISSKDVALFTSAYSKQINEKYGNCVFIIDKNSLEVLKKIDISKYAQPKGIIIDDQMNFYITSLDSSNEYTSKNRKLLRDLIKFDEHGEILQKTSLEIENTFQIIFYEKKLLISSGYFKTPPIHLIEFY